MSIIKQSTIAIAMGFPMDKCSLVTILIVNENGFIMNVSGSHRHQKESGIAVIAMHIGKKVFLIKKRKIKQEKHMVIEFII